MFLRKMLREFITEMCGLRFLDEGHPGEGAGQTLNDGFFVERWKLQFRHDGAHEIDARDELLHLSS